MLRNYCRARRCLDVLIYRFLTHIRRFKLNIQSYSIRVIALQQLSTTKPRSHIAHNMAESTKDVQDALVPVTTTDTGEVHGLYKTYKRRYFVLLVVVLMNTVLPWAWLSYAVVSSYSQELFGVSAIAINWFSTVYGLTFAPFVFSGWLINKYGVKKSIAVGSTLMITGSWLKYAGTLKGMYGLAMAGQTILGCAQIFVIGLPPLISETWFGPAHRTLPTALGSISPALGSMIGSLAPPYIATSVDRISLSVLIVAALSTLVGIAGFFVPAKPPTSVAEQTAARHESQSARKQAMNMLRSLEFYLIAIPFVVGLAIFNVWASLLFLYLEPYGFPLESAGLLVGLQTGLGIATALMVAPLVDKWRLHTLSLKVCFTAGGLLYLGFIWVPSSRSIGLAFGFTILMGVFGTSALAIGLETLAEILYPIPPEFPAVTCWCLGNFLGAILLFGFGEGYDPNGDPPYNYNKSLYAQGAIGVVFLVVPINLLGKFGRKEQTRLKRRDATIREVVHNTNDLHA